MKKIYLLLLGLLSIMTACQEPEYVLPTADRQGITSLTAIFTSGPFTDKEIVKYAITDASADKYVIPIPWFYPEDSEDETTPYMTAVRVRAELAPNCTIEPSLTVLDLTKDNYFVYTNAQGEKREICITGERTKSDKCELLSFSLVDPVVSGVIDNSSNTISLISADDLHSCLADITLSPHATITPDPRVEALDYNDDVTFTVVAHNGVDKKEYVVRKTIPAKIPYGFNTPLEELFNLDATAGAGIPWNDTNAPTLGVVGGQLVVCMGDGTTPLYFNQETGSKGGTINLGSAQAGCVTSDEGGHLLICNKVDIGDQCNIFMTSSVKDAPQLFYSFTNTAGLPMGAKMKVIGDVTSNAVIILTNDGISGVTSSSAFTRIVVENGEIQTPEVVDISSTGLAWGAAPVNSTSVVPASTNVTDGYFLSYYDANILTYLNGNNQIAAQLANTSGNSWAQNQNCLDTKTFNNANYLAMLLVSHFPHWGVGPQVYLYDVTSKGSLGNDVFTSPALVFKADALNWYQQGDTKTASGDVLIAPSTNGFKIYVYYYDNNSATIGGFSADCIQK